MTKAKELTLHGDHYTFGFDLGKRTADQMHELMQNVCLPKAQTDSPKFKTLFKAFLDICKTHTPDYLEEIRGMADGAGIKYHDLLNFNFRELNVMTRVKSEKSQIVDSVDDNCTTLVAPKSDHILACHNEDGPVNNSIFVLKGKIADGPRFMSICYYGWIPGISVNMNDHGLFNSLNAVRSTDIQVGLPVIFLGRSLISAKTVSEAVRTITEFPRARGENYILYQGYECVNLETSANLHKSRAITTQYAHTNHFIEEELKTKQGLVKPNSVPRLTTAQEFLRKPITDLQQFKPIMRDHTNTPLSICTHNYKNVSTLAGILFNTSKKQMIVCDGNPCSSEFHTFTL